MPPASVLDQTRETTKFLAKAQLRPYIPQLAPHLKKLAPHASRLNALFDIYAPHLAALVPELPRLLPHLGVLLDELAHLEPQLEVFVRHRNFLLPHLDVIAPHLYSLRAHRDVLAASLPRLAPHLCVLVPHTAALLPHLGPLLEAVKRGDLPVDEMAQAARLRLLLPHVAAFAPQLPAIAPYWKELLPNLDALEQMHALKPLAARLPELAPQLGRILKHRERLGARLPGLLADPEALAIELRACDAAMVGSAATAAGAGAAEGGLFSGVVRFLGGISPEETKAKAEVAAVEAAAAKADQASFIAKTRGERRVAVRRVSEALSIAARRMVEVEQKFVTEKNASANRRTHLNEEALRCAGLESSMLDVDNELVKLRSQASVLAADIQALEAVLGMENIIQARTTRQIQQINNGSHRGQSSSSSSHTKPERSFFGAIEAWGAKINM